jgi:hypothetical protein
MLDEWTAVLASCFDTDWTILLSPLDYLSEVLGALCRDL